ncbi:MAG: hypothetical protein ACWGMZ_02675, partial [Thermoguttaceae bacterium]
MTWLISQKVLPSLLLGQPPNYQTILEAQQKRPIGAWSLGLNAKQLGWALSTLVQEPSGLRKLRCRVHFDEVPLAELTSGFFHAIVRGINHHVAKLKLDASSSVSIDPLGNLVRFDSELKLYPINSVVRMFGVVVEGGRMHVEIRSDTFKYS